MSKIRAMSIMAHQDDFEFNAGGFFAMLRKKYGRGAELKILATSRGASGHHVMGMEETSKMLKDFELLAKAGEQKDRYEGFIARFEEDTTAVIAEMNDYISKNR